MLRRASTVLKDTFTKAGFMILRSFVTMVDLSFFNYEEHCLPSDMYKKHAFQVLPPFSFSGNCLSLQ